MEEFNPPEWSVGGITSIAIVGAHRRFLRQDEIPQTTHYDLYCGCTIVPSEVEHRLFPMSKTEHPVTTPANNFSIR